MIKKICLIFLLTLILVLSISATNKVKAFGIEGPGDGIDTSNICYGSGCLDTTPDSITDMNWTAPINNFNFTSFDFPNFSNAYHTGQYIYIPVENVQGKDSCSISNTELFLGEYIGPQNGASSTYYNHDITGDFYLNDYYYQSSLLNKNHIVYDIYENCQEYEVINNEWSNDISLNSIVFKTSYTTGPSYYETVYRASYYYFEYSQIKDYLVEVIDYLEENTEHSYTAIYTMTASAFILAITKLISDNVLAPFASGFTTILGIMRTIDNYEQVQSIDYVEDMVGAMVSNSDKILRLKYEWILYPNLVLPVGIRSHEILNTMDNFTYPSVNISNPNENMISINYYSYSFNSTQNLFEVFSETSLMVMEFTEE